MLGILVGLKAEARLAAPLGGIVAIGNGTAAGARRGAADLIAQGATELLSFGVAGGLAPNLPAGTLLIPSSVLLDGNTISCDPSLIHRLGGPQHGPILAGEEIIATAAEKAALHATTGADAVDLESGIVAEMGLPFAVLRAICDPATRAIPHAATVALDEFGRIRLGKLTAALARRPAELIELVRLARDAAAAHRALARHVAGRQGLCP